MLSPAPIPMDYPPRQFTVGESSEGQRLDDYLAARLPGLSRMRIAKLVGEGLVVVGGAQGRAGQKLRAGQSVEVSDWPPTPNSMTPEPLPLEIVYEDEHLVVVVKPAGVLMHPTRGVKSGTLANALAFHLNRGLAVDNQPGEGAWPSAGVGGTATKFVRPGLVHRLDRATSGLVVVAKTRPALSRLSTHFGRRLVEKLYLALLHGEVLENESVIRAPIGRDGEAWPPWRVLEGGKPAETCLRVLERRGGMTLAELEPVTGRTNQLRIHCAHVGHPVAGDEWHVSADGAPRLCLHAASLSFRHPATNEWLTFVSPLPEPVRNFWGKTAEWVNVSPPPGMISPAIKIAGGGG